MLTVNIIDEAEVLSPNHYELIRDVLKKAASFFEYEKPIVIDVSFVSPKEIQRINAEFRGIDRPTDVLSFPLEQTEWGIEELDATQHLGDIIIAFDVATSQASEYGHSLERELAFLNVHGFLHLNGYDHQTPEEEEAMFGLQERILKAYGLDR